MNKCSFLIFIIPFLFCSCEQEMGRLNLEQNNSGTIRLQLNKGEEISIWTSMDIEYEKKPLLVYDFEFYKGEQLLLKGGNDPLIVTNLKYEDKIISKGVIHHSFYGKLEGTFIPYEDTIYSFKVNLIKNNKPTLKINKAEVIFMK